MRFSLLIFLFLLSVTFFNCRSRNKIPAHILSKQKMKEVVWDMMRADRFLANFVLFKDTSLNADSARIDLYRKVFHIHNISKQKFKESFDYYKDHPNLLKTLLDSLNSGQNTKSGEIRPLPSMDTTSHRIRKPLPNNR